MTDIRTIQVPWHGRYLVVPPAVSSPGPAPLLVGFHGYAEDADAHLDRLRTIPGIDRWRIVSVQALNRFYNRRSDVVVAGWMTRQDRELVIADNVAYVSAVVDAVSREQGGCETVVFAGFSQGVAMAFRAAALGEQAPAGIISLGGDVPPELDDAALARTARVLLGRGTRDDWYTAGKFEADRSRLSGAGVGVTPVVLDAGHEWTADFSAPAGEFLASLA